MNIEVGMWVAGGHGTDASVGRVVAVEDDGEVEVAWEGHVRTKEQADPAWYVFQSLSAAQTTAAQLAITPRDIGECLRVAFRAAGLPQWQADSLVNIGGQQVTTEGLVVYWDDQDRFTPGWAYREGAESGAIPDWADLHRLAARAAKRVAEAA